MCDLNIDPTSSALVSFYKILSMEGSARGYPSVPHPYQPFCSSGHSSSTGLSQLLPQVFRDPEASKMHPELVSDLPLHMLPHIPDYVPAQASPTPLPTPHSYLLPHGCADEGSNHLLHMCGGG